MKSLMLFEKKFSFILIPFLFIISSCKINRANLDHFVNEKHKIEKALNQQKLSNYLTKLLMKNDNIIDREMYFLDNDDFNFGNDDINYSSVQVRDDDNEFKARVFSLKWGLTNSKEKQFRPFHVKEGDEKIENWKNYHVLMMGNKDNYILKKVCFPDKQGENFGIVTDFTNKCADKIVKIQDYKIYDNSNIIDDKNPLISSSKEHVNESNPSKENDYDNKKSHHNSIENIVDSKDVKKEEKEYKIVKSNKNEEIDDSNKKIDTSKKEDEKPNTQVKKDLSEKDEKLNNIKDLKENTDKTDSKTDSNDSEIVNTNSRKEKVKEALAKSEEENKKILKNIINLGENKSSSNPKKNTVKVEIPRSNENKTKPLNKLNTDKNNKKSDLNEHKINKILSKVYKVNKRIYKKIKEREKKNRNQEIKKQIGLQKDLTKSRKISKKLMKKISKLKLSEKYENNMKKNTNRIEIQNELLNAEKTNQMLLKKILEIESKKNPIRSNNKKQATSKKHHSISKHRRRNSKIGDLDADNINSKRMLNDHINKKKNNITQDNKRMRKNNLIKNLFINKLANRSSNNAYENRRKQMTIKDNPIKKHNKIKDLELINNNMRTNQVGKHNNNNNNEISKDKKERIVRLVDNIIDEKPENEKKYKLVIKKIEEENKPLNKEVKVSNGPKLIKMLNNTRSSQENTLERIEKIHKENQRLLKKIIKFIKNEKRNIKIERKLLNKEKIEREINQIFEEDQKNENLRNSKNNRNSILINNIKANNKLNKSNNNHNYPNNNYHYPSINKTDQNKYPYLSSKHLYKNHKEINTNYPVKEDVVPKYKLKSKYNHSVDQQYAYPHHINIDDIPNNYYTNHDDIHYNSNSLNNKQYLNTHSNYTNTESDSIHEPFSYENDNEKVNNLKNGSQVSNNQVDKSFIGNNHYNNIGSIDKHLLNGDDDWEYSRDFVEVVPINENENSSYEVPVISLGKVKLENGNGHYNKENN